MKRAVNFPLAAISMFALFVACNQDPKSGFVSPKIVSSTPEPVKETVIVQTLLKDARLNEKTMVSNKILAKSHKLSGEEFASLSVRSLDSTAGSENAFIYHLVDTLFSNNNIKVFLIGREYESENIVWIAVYNGQGKLLDHKQVYYDNAEGFLLIESSITNNQLSITTQNDFEGEGTKKTLRYKLGPDNKIEQVK